VWARMANKEALDITRVVEAMGSSTNERYMNDEVTFLISYD